MIVTSVLALLGVGAVAAVLLAVASQLLRVEENPLVELVAESLPGANCGGCGFAGCEAYAAAVVVNTDVPANLCTVGGPETSAKVGELSGKAVMAGEPVVSFRRCSRNEGNVLKRFSYVGTSTCDSAAMLEDGPYMCAWSCLGLGDCMRACPFDAIYIENGMAEIIASKCVSCGQCIKACPRSILQLIPRRARVACHCATHEKMKAVSDVCGIGCISCLKCVKACPAKAISIEDSRIEIDHATCLKYGAGCNEACVTTCPRFILHRRMPSILAAPQAGEEGVECPESPLPSLEPTQQSGPMPPPEESAHAKAASKESNP